MVIPVQGGAEYKSAVKVNKVIENTPGKIISN